MKTQIVYGCIKNLNIKWCEDGGPLFLNLVTFAPSVFADI